MLSARKTYNRHRPITYVPKIPYNEFENSLDLLLSSFTIKKDHKQPLHQNMIFVENSVYVPGPWMFILCSRENHIYLSLWRETSFLFIWFFVSKNAQDLITPPTSFPLLHVVPFQHRVLILLVLLLLLVVVVTVVVVLVFY